MWVVVCVRHTSNVSGLLANVIGSYTMSTPSMAIDTQTLFYILFYRRVSYFLSLFFFLFYGVDEIVADTSAGKSVVRVAFLYFNDYPRGSKPCASSMFACTCNGKKRAGPRYSTLGRARRTPPYLVVFCLHACTSRALGSGSSALRRSRTMPPPPPPGKANYCEHGNNKQSTCSAVDAVTHHTTAATLLYYYYYY